MSLLEIRNLGVEFHSDHGTVRASDHISFSLEAGEIMGIVGESGSGKSVSCLSLMRLLPMPPAKIVSGEIIFEGRDLLKISESEMRDLRGRDLTMIFQDPFTSLNPYLKISTQMMEVLETHSELRGTKAKKRCLDVLDQLGIPEPEIRFDSYPHQLSGGLKQRMMIAMSLLLQPKILIADEPTTALDVTIQAQILDLLRDINKKFGTAIILITHDLGVVAGLCDKIQVMYAGRVIERGSPENIFYDSRHPYTRGLLGSIPRLESKVGDRLSPIPGMPPDLTTLGNSCAFAARCSRVQDRCRVERPEETREGQRTYNCHFPEMTR